MRSAVVGNGGAVPPGVAACVVLCLRRGVGEERKSGEKKGRRNLAMKLHKVSDAVRGKIKAVASSKTCAYKTVVKMFPFINARPYILRSFHKTVQSVTYMINLVVIILLKMQIEGLC